MTEKNNISVSGKQTKVGKSLTEYVKDSQKINIILDAKSVSILMVQFFFREMQLVMMHMDHLTLPMKK